MVRTVRIATCLLACVLPAGAAARQHGPAAPVFDRKTVETVTGTVQNLELVSTPRGSGKEMRLTLKTDREALPVRVGPAWYLDKEDLKIEPGDRLTIEGSRVTVAGAPVLLVSEIRKGARVVAMRDPDGTPRWTRKGRR